MVRDEALLDRQKPDSNGHSKQLSSGEATEPLHLRTAGHASALTPRELEVLGQVLRGRSNKEIAYKLGIANSTVRVLIWRASRRLNVNSRATLIERIVHLGMPRSFGRPSSPERQEASGTGSREVCESLQVLAFDGGC